MKKYRNFIIFSLTIAFVSCSEVPTSFPYVPPANANYEQPPMLSWISKFGLDSFFKINIVRGADSGYVALFAKDGHLIHATAKGFADIESEIPMQVNTRFRIASMTKPVTAVAILKLMEEGKLRLDDPINLYLPNANDMTVAISQSAGVDGKIETRPLNKQITIFDLLTFRSGIGDEKGKSDLGKLWGENYIFSGLGSLEERVNKIMRVPLYEDPGETWRYGWSTDLLARIVEVVSGATFDVYLENEIFKPLGMLNTNFLSMETNQKSIAEVYSKENGNLVHIVEPRSNPLDWTPGSSGLVSSAPDYMRFALMLWNQGTYNGIKILSPESIGLMTQTHVKEGVLVGQVEGVGFGLGVGVVIDSEKSVSVDRDGDFWWSGFYGTHFFVSPQTNLVGVIMTQNQPAKGSSFPGSYGVYIAPIFAFWGI